MVGGAPVEVRGQLEIVKSLHVGSKDQTQVLGVGGKHLYALSHPACPRRKSFYLALLAVSWAHFVLTALASWALEDR